MTLKRGRFGTFFACSGYPDCKTTRAVDREAKKPDVPLDEKCPQCGSNLVRKTGRYGEFTPCSNYPTCKYVKQNTIGVTCPKAGLRGRRLSSVARGAVEHFTAAAVTLIAISLPGASPWLSPVPSAEARTWKRSSSKPALDCSVLTPSANTRCRRSKPRHSP